jgi:hypothetical protein
MEIFKAKTSPLRHSFAESVHELILCLQINHTPGLKLREVFDKLPEPEQRSKKAI